MASNITANSAEVGQVAKAEVYTLENDFVIAGVFKPALKVECFGRCF
jgi:hypothetical protein